MWIGVGRDDATVGGVLSEFGGGAFPGPEDFRQGGAPAPSLAGPDRGRRPPYEAR
jgi:hypothetical protein